MQCRVILEIISEMLDEKIYLILLLLVHFVRSFSLELIYYSSLKVSGPGLFIFMVSPACTAAMPLLVFLCINSIDLFLSKKDLRQGSCKRVL